MLHHLEQLRTGHPDLYERIDEERVASWSADFAASQYGDDFAALGDGGRGDLYLRAQAHNLTARAHGIGRLLDIIRDGTDTPIKKVVDVLGGDGLVTRVARSLDITDMSILTCDLSPFMVRAAWSANHPALLQKADRLLQRDSSMDGVLVAYGSHHIPADDRGAVAQEAYRVLRPGGVLVLHDFLTGSPMDEWFGTIVDKYSVTRHQYDHFTRTTTLGYLEEAGFDHCTVMDMSDPFMATGPDAAAAELALGRYLLDMYGLVDIDRRPGQAAEAWAVEHAKRIFRYPRLDGSVDEFSLRFDEQAGVWRCTLPRMAIVAVGRKAG